MKKLMNDHIIAFAHSIATVYFFVCDHMSNDFQFNSIVSMIFKSIRGACKMHNYCDWIAFVEHTWFSIKILFWFAIACCQSVKRSLNCSFELHIMDTPASNFLLPDILLFCFLCIIFFLNSHEWILDSWRNWK